MHVAMRTFLYIILIVVTAARCTQPSLTAEEIIARSVEAHGGDALSNWQSIVIKGEAVMQDLGNSIRSEYIISAEKPEKVRVDIDLTKFERGRQIFTYFYNNGIGWMQYNLSPSYRSEYTQIHKHYLDHCYGIAYYAENSDLSLLSEKRLNGKKVYKVCAVAESDTAMLYIDKETFYFVGEEYRDTRGLVKCIFGDFENFGQAVYPTSVKQKIAGDNRPELEVTYKTVEHNVLFESWMFEEDMPKTAQVK